MLYRANLTFAPSGGQRVRQGEVVEITDADLGPYQAAVGKGWLVAVEDAYPFVVRPPVEQTGPPVDKPRVQQGPTGPTLKPGETGTLVEPEDLPSPDESPDFYEIDDDS